MIGLATALCGGYSTSIDGASRLASYRRGDEMAEGAVTGRSRSNEISFLSWLSRFLFGGGGSSGWPNTKPLAAAAMAVPVPISYTVNTRLDKDPRLRKGTILLMLLRLSKPNVNVSISPNSPIPALGCAVAARLDVCIMVGLRCGECRLKRSTNLHWEPSAWLLAAKRPLRALRSS